MPSEMRSMLSEADLSGLLRKFADTTNETIIITDANLLAPEGPVVLYANPAVLQTPGTDADRFVGYGMFKWYATDHREKLRQQLQDAYRSRQPVMAEWEVQITDAANRHIWLQVNVIPVFNPDQSLRAFIRVGRDVTARKHSEHERETTQRLLASVLGVIDNAIAVVDDNLKFIMINTALTRQFGWSVMDILGKAFTTVVAEPDKEGITQRLFSRREIGVTLRRTAQLLCRDGNRRQGEVVATAIEQPGGRRFFVVTLLPKIEPPAGEASEMEQALQTLMRKAGPSGFVVAGKLQLIGLEEVRAVFAERWASVMERVISTAENIVKRHLLVGDVFQRTKDDGFLICFAELTEAEAQFKARVIGQEIRERLIGEIPEMADVRVESYAAQMPVAMEGSTSETDITSALEARLHHERDRVIQAALQTLQSTLLVAQIAFQTVRTDTNQPAPLLMSRLPPALDQALQTVLALGQNNFAIEAETLLLTGAGERALAEVAQNRQDLIIVPVRLETLSHRRDADRWLQVARTVGDSGKRRLVAEITDLRRETAATRLSDFMSMASSLFRTIAYELPTADPNFLGTLPRGVLIVTIPIHRLAIGGDHVEAARRLLKGLATRNTRLLVKGVSNTAQAASLARAGVPLLLTSQVSW